MFDFFVKKTADDSFALTTTGIITLSGIFLLIFIIAIYGSNKGKSSKITTKQLVFCAIAMALALVTSYIELFSFPFGGSVTLLSMGFVCMIGYLYGPRISIPVAIAYGLLQFIIKPYIYHPVQVLFDYPLAFGALGLSGFFYQSKNGLIKGYLLGIVGRWIFSAVSGYVFFAEYAWNGWNPLAYTLAYNGSYIYSEAAITILLFAIPAVSKAIAQVKKMALEA